MKKIVIIGSGINGLVASNYLAKEDYDVTVIDNLFRGKLSNLEEVKDRINFFKLDILDLENLRKTLQNMDGVFHQAALTSVPESYEKESEYKKVNVAGTENIFKIFTEIKFIN